MRKTKTQDAYGGYRTYVGYNTDDTCCGACFEPVIHDPEQCIVMQMHVQQDEKD